MSSSSLTGSADGASGALTFGDKNTTLATIGKASASGPPTVSQTRQIVKSLHSYRLDPTNNLNPTLQLNEKNIVSTVTFNPPGIDSIGIQSSADIKTATILLTDNPASGAGILGLSVTAGFIHSVSSASYIFGPDRGALTGTASFDSLTISGALIGGTLTFSGAAAPNSVLFQNASITITLDHQVVSAPAGGTAAPNQITTDAIDIHLTNATLFGQTMSGDIILGQSSATLVPPRHV